VAAHFAELVDRVGCAQWTAVEQRHDLLLVKPHQSTQVRFR
jgi:hypothetical protein